MKKNIRTRATESLDRTVQKLRETLNAGGILNIAYSGYELNRTGYMEISLYTASQLLWAISICDNIERTDTLPTSIRGEIFKALSNKESNSESRLFSDAFMLWGLSSSNTVNIEDPLYKKLVERIIIMQKQDGSWGTYSSADDGSVRGTSLAIIALTEYVRIMGKNVCNDANLPISSIIQKGIQWLFDKFDNDLLWDSDRRREGVDKNTYMEHFEIRVERNSLAIYAILHSINSACFHASKDELAKLNTALNILEKIDFKMATFVAEIEDEVYTNDKGNTETHLHGAGGLEFYILMVLELRRSNIKDHLFHYSMYINLDRAVEQFLKCERNGAWKDKNTNNIARWTTAHAIRVLSEYKKPLSEIEISKYIIAVILKFLYGLKKVLLNPISIIVIGLSIIVIMIANNKDISPQILAASGYLSLLALLIAPIINKVRQKER